MALLLAKKIGWLQHIKGSQALIGLPLYLVPGLILFVSAISWYVLFIPALAAAGWALAMTVDKITSKRSKAFRKFVISGGVCLAVWVVVLMVDEKDLGGVTAWYVLLSTLETIWAGIFGMELAADFKV